MLHDGYKSHAAKAVCENWLRRYPQDKEVLNFYTEVTTTPNVFDGETLNLHHEDFDARDHAKDPYGVFVGSVHHKVAYLVINKCGCSSFRDMILRLDYKGCGGALKNVHTHYDNDFSLFAPKTYPLPDYFRFTFVRNPYARVRSFYTDRILNDPEEKFITREAPQYKSFFKAGMPFQVFTKNLLRLPMEDMEQHLAPQTFFLFSKNRLVVDFIGRLERIKTDFEIIKGYINADVEMLHVRKTTLPEHCGLYDEAAASHVFEKYRVDFDFLGYGKDTWKDL
jgi:hypothetical protein